MSFIRGNIPVAVSCRRPEPIQIPLSESIGKSYRSDGVDLTVLSCQPAQTSLPATVQVAVKSLNEENPPENAGIGNPLGDLNVLTHQNIEILDDQGHSLSWFPSSTVYNGDENRVVLTIASRGSRGAPTTLRYYNILRANSEIPFEFRDIPIP